MRFRALRGGRFVLWVLILLLLLFPIVEEMARPALLIAVVAVVFVAGVAAVRPGRRQVRTAIALGVVQIVFTVAAVVLDENSFAYRGAVCFGLAATTVLIVHSIYCVLRYVLAADSISHDQIYAGICVYLMLGFAFGCAYYLINILNPAGFAVHGVQLARGVPDMMYFSFVTLATLGYGDITPVAKAARTLAELEAVAGTVYMAVFMARLVSLYPSRGSSNLEKSHEDGPHPAGRLRAPPE